MVDKHSNSSTITEQQCLKQAIRKYLKNKLNNTFAVPDKLYPSIVKHVPQLDNDIGNSKLMARRNCHNNSTLLISDISISDPKSTSEPRKSYISMVILRFCEQGFGWGKSKSQAKMNTVQPSPTKST